MKIELPNFDNEVMEGDEVLNTDIKINPDYYIHCALVNAQKSLLKENIREGFIQYWGFVEHIELLCCAANMLPEDYDNTIVNFKSSDEYKNSKDEITKNVILSNKKLKLMMSEVFNSIFIFSLRT